MYFLTLDAVFRSFSCVTGWPPNSLLLTAAQEVHMGKCNLDFFQCLWCTAMCLWRGVMLHLSLPLY